MYYFVLDNKTNLNYIHITIILLYLVIVNDPDNKLYIVTLLTPVI